MKSIIAALAAAALSWTPALGWWGDGHGILTRAAFQALPRMFRLSFTTEEK